MFSEVYLKIKELINETMPIIANENLISKSIEYAIDLPIDFNTNSSLLKLLKGVLSKRYLTTTKSIWIQDDKSLRFTSYSFKAKLKEERWSLPIKFQIYNKQTEIKRLVNKKLLSIIPAITRFELTILSSRSPFSERTLNNYKNLYYSFLRPIDPNELIVFEKMICFQLYKNFCEEKLEAPKLQVIYFILKNSEHFLTADILKGFYQLLFNSKLSKTLPKVSFYKFKKSKHSAIIRFSSVQELNNLIDSLRLQLY